MARFICTSVFTFIVLPKHSKTLEKRKRLGTNVVLPAYYCADIVTHLEQLAPYSIVEAQHQVSNTSIRDL